VLDEMSAPPLSSRGSSIVVPDPDRDARLGLLAAAAAAVLSVSGDDPSREGLLETPRRAASAWEFFTAGYRLDPRDVVGDAVFAADGAQLVSVDGIRFHSLCEHHLLPFFGTVAIRYAPADRIIGLSKLARLVDVFARRLQVQERLTVEIAEAVADVVDPRGVRVVVEAEHLCMAMRGVERPGAQTRTEHAIGVLVD
jgi:GTP cyclohydrolase I